MKPSGASLKDEVQGSYRECRLVPGRFGFDELSPNFSNVLFSSVEAVCREAVRCLLVDEVHGSWKECLLAPNGRFPDELFSSVEVVGREAIRCLVLGIVLVSFIMADVLVLLQVSSSNDKILKGRPNNLLLKVK